jgi:hypothetical protein
MQIRKLADLQKVRLSNKFGKLANLLKFYLRNLFSDRPLLLQSVQFRVPYECVYCLNRKSQICRRYQRHRWQFATGINDTGGRQKCFYRLTILPKGVQTK